MEINNFVLLFMSLLGIVLSIVGYATITLLYKISISEDELQSVKRTRNWYAEALKLKDRQIERMIAKKLRRK